MDRANAGNNVALQGRDGYLRDGIRFCRREIHFRKSRLATHSNTSPTANYGREHITHDCEVGKRRVDVNVAYLIQNSICGCSK